MIGGTGTFAMQLSGGLCGNAVPASNTARTGRRHDLLRITFTFLSLRLRLFRWSHRRSEAHCVRFCLRARRTKQTSKASATTVHVAGSGAAVGLPVIVNVPPNLLTSLPEKGLSEKVPSAKL